jgi:hypothetical protein
MENQKLKKRSQGEERWVKWTSQVEDLGWEVSQIMVQSSDGRNGNTDTSTLGQGGHQKVLMDSLPPPISGRSMSSTIPIEAARPMLTPRNEVSAGGGVAKGHGAILPLTSHSIHNIPVTITNLTHTVRRGRGSGATVRGKSLGGRDIPVGGINPNNGANLYWLEQRERQ